MMRVDRVLGSVSSSSSSAAGSDSASLIAAEVLPPWLECASSMTMANVLPRCSSPISSRMNGNFCTVEMMIFLPSSMNLRRSPECSAWPTVAPTCANCLIVSLDLLVEDAPVGDDDDRVEDLLVVALQADELVREPGDGVRLAAARRVLDQVALARAVRAHIGQQPSAPRRAGGSAGKSACASSCRSCGSFSSTICA